MGNLLEKNQKNEIHSNLGDAGFLCFVKSIIEEY